MDDQFLKLMLPVLGLCCCMDFSLFAENRGCSAVVTHRFLIAVASLVDHGLWVHRLQQLQLVGSRAQAQ